LSKSNTKLLRYFTKEPNSNPAWFALPFILNSKTCSKDIYLNYLESNNIETRPVVTGNFTKQPVFKDLNIDIDPSTFVNAEIIHNQGFFIGLPSYLLSDEKIKNLVDILLAV
jgi:CDP-4-dehydro-6-deoxyglucose reductase, E1